MVNKRALKQHWPVMLLAAAVVLIFLAAMMTFQVRETQLAIVKRFGKPIEKADGKAKIFDPGLHFRWPFIDEVWYADRRLQAYELKRGRHEQITTSDNYQIVVSTYVLWRVGDADVFLRRFQQPEDATSELDSLVRSARNNVLTRHPLSELINVNPTEAHIAFIEDEILEQVQATAAREYGIEVRDLGFKHLGFPEQVSQKVFARMRAERETKSREYISQGEREARRIRAEADRKASDIINKAEAEATLIRAEGDTVAAKNYAVFRENPELAAFLRKLRSLRLTLSEKTTLVVDTNTPPYDLFLRGATEFSKTETGEPPAEEQNTEEAPTEEQQQ